MKSTKLRMGLFIFNMDRWKHSEDKKTENIIDENLMKLTLIIYIIQDNI